MSPGSVVLQMVTVRGLRREVTGRGLWFAKEVRASRVWIGAHPLQRGPRPGRCIPLLILQSGAHGRGPHPLPEKGKPPHPRAAEFLDTWHLASLGARKRHHSCHDLIDERRAACWRVPAHASHPRSPSSLCPLTLPPSVPGMLQPCGWLHRAPSLTRGFPGDSPVRRQWGLSGF